MIREYYGPSGDVVLIEKEYWLDGERYYHLYDFRDWTVYVSTPKEGGIRRLTKNEDGEPTLGEWIRRDW